ncbi:STAS domain-containing protein [Bacillota bacterium Meth-B3]|nr:STAS domain-containing protein [Christensenellaceae bacterium]MEA5065686.1 STAS domain-containing protein [Eubacteriales bacterium]MEA5069594.1 STAS domain-containing protein [Christensenellaceae bacterium]
MTITRADSGNERTLSIAGRIDAATAPQLEAELNSLDGVTSLTLDLKDLAYISSAGLRVLLAAQKRMMKQGAMRVVNVCEPVMDVFEMTGFADILTIE